MADTAQNDLSPVWLELMKQVREHLDVCHASPARSVVLLPFAQLAPLAKRAWASVSPQGFMPRFETTRTWAQRLASFAPGSSDVSLNAARWFTYPVDLPVGIVIALIGGPFFMYLFIKPLRGS